VLTTIAAYRVLAGDLDRSLGNTAKQPQVARETAYYLANIGEVKSIDDLMANDRLYRYAMKAFGLQDMAYAKAFVRKALTEGIEDREAFANRLTDQRYREFVETFNFAQLGEATTGLDRARQGVVDRHLRQNLEENAGKQNEGVRLALYFERKATGIDNAFELLADPALLKVVQTALRLPIQMSLQDIDKQAELITRRLDLDDLSDPDKLKQFVHRFLTMWEIDNPTAPPVTPNIVIGRPSGFGIQAGLLAALQNLKLGGR
jgi:hypothetical protein